MRNLQISLMTLAKAGFTRPAQANCFFPEGNQTDHIHLGVPTSFLDGDQQRFAEEGNVFVTYISLKKGDTIWFRLDHNDSDGYFSFPNGRQLSDLPPSWQTALQTVGIVR